MSVYEKAMVAIFNNYHDLPYDKTSIESFVQETISKAPAGFDEEEIDLFYLQHVALKCVYHLNLIVPEAMIIPFLNDEDNFHNQASAARALQACNSDLSRQELVKTISDTTKSHFVKVICTWSLCKLNPTMFKVQLQELEKSSSDESDGFGGNIMDPRVCTNIPGLKSAIKKLLDNL